MAQDHSGLHLLALPVELLLRIAASLDVPDLFALRKTSKSLAELTRDKSPWISLLSRQSDELPLPLDMCEPSAWLACDTPTLESTASQVYLSHLRWPKARSTPPLSLFPSFRTELGSIHCILYLQVFASRWLICVYADDLISLWDLQEKTPRKCWDCAGLCQSRVHLHNQLWTSASAAEDIQENEIVLAVTHDPGPATTCVLRIPLRAEALDEDGRGYYVEAAPRFRTSHLIRDVAPSQSLLAFSRGPLIDVVNWSVGDSSATISTQDEELDELWNGIIDVKFCGIYMLCLKTRSMEVYALPELSSPGTGTRKQAPLARHAFADLTLRGTSVSYSCSPASALASPVPPAGFALRVLAWDVIKGLFQYHISFTAETPLPTLDIRLEQAHRMASLDISASRLRTAGTPTPSRGFVTACALGPEGKRGMWVERRRGSTQRDVNVFDVRCLSGTLKDSEELTAPEIEGHVVYEVASYDLREDITHCSFCEVTGRIVLGTRGGEIRLL